MLLENVSMAGPILDLYQEVTPTSTQKSPLFAFQHLALLANVSEAQVPCKNWVCDLENSLSHLKETPLTCSS